MGEAREIGEACVGGQHENEHCGELCEDEHDLSESAGSVDRVGDLGDHGLALHRNGLELRSKPRNAEEHEREHCAHDHEG
ncbi:unannotated protein [freshwater metagenome]|uniref:Unannotated protein n=1 Tax=freshwater metagenome TaxID=449393 RepID=A0A6J7IC62_9ZZZZ